MRLIDLDQIEYFTLVDKLGVPRYKIEIGEDIGVEEVKAIPIDWLISKSKELVLTKGTKFYSILDLPIVYDLIEEWRKENEANR